MGLRAQAGLEYLMTYGWALVLIATVVGVLVFIASNPFSDVRFSCSDKKLFLEGSSVGTASYSDNISFALKNLTGGPITVTFVGLSGDIADFAGINASLNGEPVFGELDIVVPSGVAMQFENFDGPTGGPFEGRVELHYTDVFGFEKTALITGSGLLAGTAPAVISSCPYTISTPGVYNLSGSLSSAATCVTVDSSNVLLNCKGSTITGPNRSDSFYGVRLNAVQKATVTNCSLNEFYYAIFLNGASNSTVSSNKTNSRRGVTTATNASNNLVLNNTTNTGQWGLIILGADNSVIGNTANSNDLDGLELRGTGHLIKNNTFNSNERWGMWVYVVSDSTIEGNTVSNNVSTGIWLWVYTAAPSTNTNNRIVNNTITENTGVGIYLDSYSNNNTVSGNTVRSNSSYGILASGSGNSVNGNTACANSGYDIYCTATSASGSGNKAGSISSGCPVTVSSGCS